MCKSGDLGDIQLSLKSSTKTISVSSSGGLRCRTLVCVCVCVCVCECDKRLLITGYLLPKRATLCPPHTHMHNSIFTHNLYITNH